MEKEITITVNENILNGLNNAIAAYGDLIWSIILGVEISSKFEKLTRLSEEELYNRFDAIKNLYKEIEKTLTAIEE